MKLNIRNFPFFKKEQHDEDDFVSIKSSEITITDTEGKVKRINNVNICEKGSIEVTSEGIFINGKKYEN